MWSEIIVANIRLQPSADWLIKISLRPDLPSHQAPPELSATNSWIWAKRIGPETRYGRCACTRGICSTCSPVQPSRHRRRTTTLSQRTAVSHCPKQGRTVRRFNRAYTCLYCTYSCLYNQAFNGESLANISMCKQNQISTDFTGRWHSRLNPYHTRQDRKLRSPLG